MGDQVVMSWTSAYALAFARARLMGDAAAGEWLATEQAPEIIELDR